MTIWWLKKRLGRVEAEEDDAADVEDVEVGQAVGVEADDAVVLQRFVDQRRQHHRRGRPDARHGRVVVLEPLLQRAVGRPAADQVQAVVGRPAGRRRA